MVSRRANFKQIYTKSSQRLRREIKKVEIGQKEKEIIFGKTESMNWSDEVKTFRNQTKCCWHLVCEAACAICKLALIFAGKPHQALGKKMWLPLPVALAVLFQTGALQQRLRRGVSLQKRFWRCSYRKIWNGTFDCVVHWWGFLSFGKIKVRPLCSLVVAQTVFTFWRIGGFWMPNYKLWSLTTCLKPLQCWRIGKWLRGQLFFRGLQGRSMISQMRKPIVCN